MKLSIKLVATHLILTLFSFFWAYFLIIPTSELLLGYISLNQDMTTFLKFAFVVVFSFLPFTIIYLFLVSKYVLDPIKEMSKVAKIVTTGHLGKRIVVTSNDEFGELSTTLNTMIQNLANAFQSVADSLKDTIGKEKQLIIEKLKVEKAKASDDALLSGIGDGILATDSNGKIVYVNQEIKNLLGWEFNEVLGKDWSEILSSLDNKSERILPKEQQLVYKVLQDGLRINFKTKYMRRDGSIFPVSTIASPINLGGKIFGSVIVFRDITKEYEIDRMKTEFISLASHQLRTPLSAIRWFVELLQEQLSNITPEQKEIIENISVSTKRMIELVNTLLNISRIESGRLIINSRPTNIKDLISSTLKELQIRIQQRQLQVFTNFPDNIPIISVDPRLIREVYLNLLTNAIKYTPQGGKITISLALDDKYLISKVEDSGMGIPEKDKPRIFQKFFRADNAQKIDTDGTGLGLYLAKIITQSSLGKLWFESEENKGSKFYFSLSLLGTPTKDGEVTLS